MPSILAFQVNRATSGTQQVTLVANLKALLNNWSHVLLQSEDGLQHLFNCGVHLILFPVTYWVGFLPEFLRTDCNLTTNRQSSSFSCSRLRGLSIRLFAFGDLSHGSGKRR